MEKKLDMGGGLFKNANGGVYKTMNVKPNIQTPNFYKAFCRPWERIIDTFELIMITTTLHWAKICQILAETWAIIGEFDNFGQIFKLLNVILDQFIDCNAIIDHYTHITVHKLD